MKTIPMPTNSLGKIRDLLLTGEPMEHLGKIFRTPNGKLWKIGWLPSADAIDPFSGHEYKSTPGYSIAQIEELTK